MHGGFVMYHVDFMWDDEALVWVASSEDIPGLIMEAESFDYLMERVKNAIPELLELNGIKGEKPILFRSERIQQMYA